MRLNEKIYVMKLFAVLSISYPTFSSFSAKGTFQDSSYNYNDSSNSKRNKKPQNYYNNNNNVNDNNFTNNQRFELGKLKYGTHSNKNVPTGPNISTNEMDNISLPNTKKIFNKKNSFNFNRSDQLKSGYYHSLWKWTDDNFLYNKYAFEYTNQSVPSPFYFYSSLPGYLVVDSDSGVGLSSMTSDLIFQAIASYSWNPSNITVSDGNLGAIDQHIKHMILAFTTNNPRLLGTYLPVDDAVNISLENQVNYSLSGDSLWNILYDCSNATETIKYDCIQANSGFYAQQRDLPAILQSYKKYVDYKESKNKPTTNQGFINPEAFTDNEKTQNILNIFGSIVKTISPTVAAKVVPPTEVEPDSLQLIFSHNYKDGWKRAMTNYHIWTFEFNSIGIPILKTLITTQQNPLK